MQTIKTAVVVVLLLFVLYGGYIALNHREPELNSDLQGLVGPDVFNADVDLPEPNYAPPSSSSASRATPGSLPSAPNGSTPSNAFEAFAKNPNPSFSAPPPCPPQAPPNHRPLPPIRLSILSYPKSPPWSCPSRNCLSSHPRSEHLSVAYCPNPPPRT